MWLAVARKNQNVKRQTNIWFKTKTHVNSCSTCLHVVLSPANSPVKIPQQISVKDSDDDKLKTVCVCEAVWYLSKVRQGTADILRLLAEEYFTS